VEGGERPHITVIVDWAQLQAARRGVMLDYGGRASAAELRSLLCDAKITPVVFGRPSQPLDVGRERRCVSLAQRRAIAARDRGCAHPGCPRAPSRCQVHHIHEWVDGGATDLDNLVMVCRTHHRMVHQSGWEIRMRESRPEFIPPKWLDPLQIPRRQPMPT